MSTYAFRAIDLAGTPSKGELEACVQGPGQRAAPPARADHPRRLRGGARPMKIDGFMDRFRGGISRAGRLLAVRDLVSSGIAVLRSLYTLEEQTQDDKITGAIVGLRNDVEAGGSVADAMERSPGIFDPLFRSMVRAGATNAWSRRSRWSRFSWRSWTPCDARSARDDVPGTRLHPRSRRDDRRRRLHRPGLHRDLRGARLGTPGESAELPFHDPDHGQRSGSR